KTKPIPKEFETIIFPKLVEYNIIQENGPFPDQIIVNEYKPGQGISAHFDNVHVFGDIIISITLGSQCTMVFRKYSIEEKELLIPCSALIISGEYRLKWTHEIEQVKQDQHPETKEILKRGTRTSITLRFIK